LNRRGDKVRVGGRLVAFGPFEWDDEQRLLYQNGMPVRMSDRLLTLLGILLDRPGRLISQDELLSRAWPDEMTDAANLRAHMSALKKILGDGRAGSRYIINEHGRGYGFVGTAASTATEGVRQSKSAIFPLHVTSPVGREELIADISAALTTERLVTITGSGGTGKSTVAIAVAQRSPQVDEVRFVDLSILSEATSVTPNVAMALGLENVSNPVELAALLRTKRILLLLDSCDHVVEGVAALVEALLSTVQSLRILITSREPLRAPGERVFRLGGLGLPEKDQLTTAQAARYPAVQLFLERAAASSPGFFLSDRETPELIKLCRRLDGLPLAIELAAARIDILGLQEMSGGADARPILHAQGRRTAVARHRTLLALLDWSFQTLSPAEKHVLCHVSVFRARFGLEEAIAVSVTEHWSPDDITFALATLAAKSLLNVDVSNGAAQYRLFEITRSYASDKFTSDRCRNETNRRHAKHFATLMESAQDDLLTLEPAAWSRRYGRFVGDVTAALEWAFSPDGDDVIATTLTLVSAPFAQLLGLFDEYRERFGMALERIGKIGPEVDSSALALGIALNMELAQIGDTLGFQQAREAARELYERTGQETLEGVYSEWGDAFTKGDYPLASRAADRLAKIADDIASEAYRVAAMRLTAQTLHFQGRHAESKRLALLVLDSPFENLPFSKISHKVSMRIILARIAFLEGEEDAAMELSSRVVDRAREQHPSALLHALTIAAIPVALWCGLVNQAEPLVELALGVAARHKNAYWGQLASNLGDAISFKRGRFVASSFGRLVDEDDTMRNVKMSDMLPTFDERFLSMSAIQRVENGVSGWNAPEILRIKALRIAKENPAESTFLLIKASRLAEKQGAMAWKRRIELS
jgi:predicted ATPase/DNA-binding winged helix-turn-helix (wHTH) protein